MVDIPRKRGEFPLSNPGMAQRVKADREREKQREAKRVRRSRGVPLVGKAAEESGSPVGEGSPVKGSSESSVPSVPSSSVGGSARGQDGSGRGQRSVPVPSSAGKRGVPVVRRTGEVVDAGAGIVVRSVGSDGSARVSRRQFSGEPGVGDSVTVSVDDESREARVVSVEERFVFLSVSSRVSPPVAVESSSVEGSDSSSAGGDDESVDSVPGPLSMPGSAARGRRARRAGRVVSVGDTGDRGRHGVPPVAVESADEDGELSSSEGESSSVGEGSVSVESSAGRRVGGFSEWSAHAGEEDEEDEPVVPVRGKKGDGFRLMPRDVELLKFFARYRYGTKEQGARLVGTSPGAVNNRILRIGHAGFLRKEMVSNGKGVWTPTREGLRVAGFDFRVLGKGQISLVTMAHTLGLGNLGVEVEVGEGDVLFGEELGTTRVITEREVRGSQERMKKEQELRESDEWVGDFVPSDFLVVDEEVDPAGLSPEIVPGNEGLFVLEGSSDIGAKEHVPDMVIPRPRDAQGFPRSLAVELELTPKSQKEWTRILLTYMEQQIFEKVVYFTHKPAIVKNLRVVARGIGMSEDKLEIRKYVPFHDNLIWG